MTLAVSRRRVLKGLSAVVTGTIAAPMLNFGHFDVFAGTSETYSARTVDLMRRAEVIDMLGPLSIDFSNADRADPLTDDDAADFRAFGITAFHNSFGFGGRDAYSRVLRYFAAWSGFIARNDGLFTLVNDVDDIMAARVAGKIAVIMGVQNADHFRSTEDVALFWDLGQRCSQLTCNSRNLPGAGGTERADGGLSDFGMAIVEEMNKVGMLVDVSNCGDRTTLDAIAISGQPIAITHSNCRALNNCPHLTTDQAIRKLAAKGGVMGIAGMRSFVRNREPLTIGQMVDHIDHVARLTSIDHVGISSETGPHGCDEMPVEMSGQLRAAHKSSDVLRKKPDTDKFDHPGKFYDLMEALLRRGYSADHVLAVLGGNFRRLLGQVWSANKCVDKAHG